MPELGDLVALYGAILATVVGFRQWRQGRKPLRVQLENVWSEPFHDEDGQEKVGPKYLRASAINRGSEPIKVVRLGIRFKIDYRRVPDDVLGSEAEGEYDFDIESVKLSKLDAVHGTVPEAQIVAHLHQAHPLGMLLKSGVVIRPRFSPMRQHTVWAEDAFGHRYAARVCPYLKDAGYEGYQPNATPILRGRLKATWYRVSIAMFDMRVFGREPGPSLIGVVHRLGLIPRVMPSTEEEMERDPTLIDVVAGDRRR